MKEKRFKVNASIWIVFLITIVVLLSSFTTTIGAILNVQQTGSMLVTGLLDGQVPVTITTTSTVTVGSTYESGFYYNQEATAGQAVTYNLPTAAAGIQKCFKNSYNGSAGDTGILTIQTSAAGQSFIYNGVVGASDGYMVSNGALGDSICIVGISTTQWEAYPQVGTWAVH